MNTDRIFIALMLSALISAPAHSQEQGDLFGNWQASCEFFGNRAKCTQLWEHGINDQFLQMQYRVIAADDGRQLFAGNLLLKQEQNQTHGYWTDSNGSLHPVHGNWQDNQLENHWGKSTTERGRSRYKLTGDSLLVTDWVLKDAGWHEFMAVTYTRQSQHKPAQE